MEEMSLEKEVTLAEQGLEDPYEPLFCDLHVVLAQFTTQSKFHVPLSTPGRAKSICRLLEGRTPANNPLTRITGIASLYGMRKVTSGSWRIAAAPLAKPPLLFSPAS